MNENEYIIVRHVPDYFDVFNRSSSLLLELLPTTSLFCLPAQILALAGRLPDTVVACVGGGSNAIGLFAGFLNDPDVKLVSNGLIRRLISEENEPGGVFV